MFIDIHDHDDNMQVINADHVMVEEQSPSFASGSQNTSSLVANKGNSKLNTVNNLNNIIIEQYMPD